MHAALVICKDGYVKIEGQLVSIGILLTIPVLVLGHILSQVPEVNHIAVHNEYTSQ